MLLRRSRTNSKRKRWVLMTIDRGELCQSPKAMKSQHQWLTCPHIWAGIPIVLTRMFAPFVHRVRAPDRCFRQWGYSRQTKELLKLTYLCQTNRKRLETSPSGPESLRTISRAIRHMLRKLTSTGTFDLDLSTRQIEFEGVYHIW